jgi:hypothetical protein
LKILIDSGFDPSDYDNIAIQWAASCGNLEIVKRLLQDDRVDPSTEYNLAIRWAAEYGHLEVVKLL